MYAMPVPLRSWALLGCVEILTLFLSRSLSFSGRRTVSAKCCIRTSFRFDSKYKSEMKVNE